MIFETQIRRGISASKEACYWKSSNIFFLIINWLDNVRQLVDPTGQLLLSQSFDPFGSVLAQAGSGQSRFGYTGEQVDPTGLVYLRARYYAPGVGRFLTPDTLIPNPIGSQDWNKYVYVGNNPVVYIDPTGRCRGLSGVAFDACAAVVMTTAAGVHKANEYRQAIFFPDANTTFADRLEASIAVGGGATLAAAIGAGGIALGGTEAVSVVSTSSATALAGSGVAASANVIGQAINKVETGERIDTGEVVIAGTVGYVAGGLAPLGATTYAGASALGGLSTISQYALTELNRGNVCSITPEGILYNAGLGVFFGGLAGPVPEGDSAFSIYARSPAIRNKAIMEIHRSQISQVVKSSSVARAILSGVGTTLNWERVEQRLREFEFIK